MTVVGLFLLVTVVAVIFMGRGEMSSLSKNNPKGNRPIRSITNELGSGDLANKLSIQKWCGSKKKLTTSLSVRDLRGNDGVAVKKGNLVIPNEERNRHILVIAKTGSGKTTRAILPVLFEDCLCPDRSTIVIDSKPEMWDKLAGLTQKHNPKKKILLFNPLDLSRSLSWNILAKIETDTDAKLIANTIIMATDNPTARADSPFFRNSALQLLNSMMVGLLSDSQEVLSMPRVHELLNSGMGNLCDWIEAHTEALRNSKTFVDLARSGSQNADTILSELSTRLAAWDLKVIREATSLDQLDLETLITEPTLLIIELRESELEMLRPLANVIVIEILRFLTKRAEQCPGQTLPRPVSIVIDEFASALGRLPDIHVKLNTLRSRNVSVVAAIQSISQIKANYEKDADSVLAGFNTKIFMPALDFQDAEWASKETGVMTVRFNVSSIGKNRRLIDFFANRNTNLQEQVQQRPVLTPDEIGRPIDNVATFFMPNTPVFQGQLVPYFEVPEINSKFEEGKKTNVNLQTSLKIANDVTQYRSELTRPFSDQPVVQSVPSATSPIASNAISPNAVTPNTITPQIVAAASSIINTSVKPVEPQKKISDKLFNQKESLSWSRAPLEVKKWWEEIENKNLPNESPLFELLQQIQRRRLTISEFHSLYTKTGLGQGSKDLRSILRLMDQQLLDKEKNSLDFVNASEEAQRWWTSFELLNGDEMLIVWEFACELNKRKIKIQEVFELFINFQCTSFAELLKHVDAFARHKEEENSRKVA